MRRGELANLTVADYDQRTRSLLVRESKFHKSRYLPLSDDANSEVAIYLAARRRKHLPVATDSSLLWNWYRNGYSGYGLGDGIHELIRETDIRTADGRFPRVHDMRHYSESRIIPHTDLRGLQSPEHTRPGGSANTE
jgi:site-specific recombinase XerD